MKNKRGGISFIGLLQIVFITLKLCHVIDWSWWWVLAPALASIVLSILIIGLAICVMAKD